MPTYMTTRLVATTDSHSAYVAPYLQSAPHNLAVCCSHPMHTASTPPDEPVCSPSSDFVPSQPHQLPANSIQSPYIHRANGLLQIAVSTPLRTCSIGAREVLAAEH